jgi:hypothetical protein
MDLEETVRRIILAKDRGVGNIEPVEPDTYCIFQKRIGGNRMGRPFRDSETVQ